MKENKTNKLQIKKLTHRVKGVDIKGQSCKNDCVNWAGDSSTTDSRCDYFLNARTTSAW